MILGAIDDRIAACFPVVMVSTAMQGGCMCENAAYLRIGQGNIDIAAAVAPRPLGLIAADDWTKELQTKGYPDLAALYKMLGHADRFEAHFHLQFPHNYNAVNRQHMYGFMNRHLKLGLPEPIVERDYLPLDIATEATVWTAEHPKPTGDQAGLAHERRLTAEWTQASEAAMQALSEDARRKIVAEGLATIVGRRLDEVGPVKFDERRYAKWPSCLLRIGTLTVAKHNEQLPMVLIDLYKETPRGTVIWLTDSGKEALYNAADGTLNPAVQKLVDNHYAVASIDMFGQGEFVAGGKSLKAQRLVQGGTGRGTPRPSCYTFGYNPPLLVQRVHDVMSLVAYYGHEWPDEKVNLIAIGHEAGPVGLLARAMLGGRIERAAIDCGGFDFRNVKRLDDPMFLPGILRYGGLDGIWKIVPPKETIKVSGAKEAVDAM